MEYNSRKKTLTFSRLQATVFSFLMKSEYDNLKLNHHANG
jgi:hypothetical protein